ncbi:putative disease resistance RPP8-like protein 2 [Bienertia sinuspersici]
MEATALVGSAGKQLGKWMEEEAKYLYGVKDKVEGLQSELEWIQCFLKSADEKKKEGDLVRKWISEINDFSYEAEDILEKYLLKVSHPRNDGIWNFMKWITCVIAKDGKSTHEVGCEIDVLTGKISRLASRMIVYGVRPTSLSMPLSLLWHNNNKKAELRRTHSHLPVDDNSIVGLTDDTRVLVDQLMNKGVKVVGITGMAGVGKTTLARKVYQQLVQGHQFEKSAWIYVSRNFQPRSVIQAILLGLYANDEIQKKKITEIDANESLQGRLYRLLEQNKCLVVLDDLWKFSDWDCLKNAFPISSIESRSRLLITTRYKELQMHVDSQGFSHQLDPLSKAYSLKLFYKKAFPDKNITSIGNLLFTKLVYILGTKYDTIETLPALDDNTKKLAEKMVARCEGLPLAIVVLGGILAHKKTLEEWGSVEKNVDTHIKSKNEDGIGITDILELSYTDLPYHLRPCFLHLGNFPKKSEIPTKKLYRMWIAEGIVAPRDDHEDRLGMNLEETANCYLHELVQRCIVQVSTTGPAKKIKSCRLHDSMWKMCTSKAEEENFLSIVSQESMDAGDRKFSAMRSGKLHRTSIHFGQHIQNKFPSDFTKASHLRSLMFFSSCPGETSIGDDQHWLHTIIKQFKLLRVLDLENTGMKEVFKEIGTLIHLRYLSIMGTQVRKLPSSIGNLRCLQTLDLRVSLPDKCVVRIPNVLWKMKSLIHLYLPLNAYKVKRFQKLRVHGLSNLEILKNFDTRRSRVTNLQQLNNLRKLSIKNKVSKTKTLKIIMQCQSIKNNNLVHLYLKIHAATLNEEPTILSSCNCLHTLKMEGINSSTQLKLESVKFPENLKVLGIKRCKLMCADPMKNLRHLLKLRRLSLKEVSFLGSYIDCSDQGFLQLVDLKLHDMDTLMKWEVGKEAMPKLYRLQIYNCNKLEMIPDGLPTSVHVVCNPCVRGIDNTLPVLTIKLHLWMMKMMIWQTVTSTSTLLDILQLFAL